MSDDSFYKERQHQSAMNFLVAQEEFSLVGLLRPKIFIDGNQWCALYGDNMQDGIAGFGDSPILAVYDFNAAWYEKISEKLSYHAATASQKESEHG